MPGTFTTDLNDIDLMEADDNLDLGTFKFATAINDDYKIEGTYCIGFGATTPNSAISLAATSSNLDLSGLGYHIFVWVKVAAWPAVETKANGGLRLAISSDTTPTLDYGVFTAVVAAGGSGYSVDNVLTIVGGTGTAGTVTVATLSGSAVATVTITTRGDYTVFPTNPASTTGAGSGCTLTLGSLRAPTNSNQWFLGGSNTETVAGWICYAVNVDGTPDFVAGSPDMNSVDRVGVGEFALGTTTNKYATVFMDALRYGTGSTITAGTGRAPVTMADYVAYDIANTRAWGIVIQQAGIYFVGGKLNFGTTSQSAETVFKDTNLVLVYQDFPVASGFYEILVKGASGQKTTFQLGNYTPASGLTSNGCTIRGSGNVSGTSRTDGVQGMAHSSWKLTASDSNQVTKLYGSTFSEILSATLAYNAVSIELTSNCTTNSTTTLVTSGSYDTSGIAVGMLITGTNIPADTYISSIESATSLTMNQAATGSGSSLTMIFTHNNEIRGCTFSNFGTITTNGCVIDNCTFQDVKTGAPISATYALIVASSTEGNRITNSKFINCNRAIKITAAGTYDFDDLTFSGNTYDIENSSAGAVIINNLGTSNASTYINTGGGTTSIITSVTLQVTVKDESGNNIQSARVAMQRTTTNSMTGALTAVNPDTGDGNRTDETTAANDATTNDMTLMQSSPAVNDAYYFGAAEPFYKLRINVGQNGSGTWTITWQYWNGSWTTIPDVNDGTNGFRAGTGNKDIAFSPPSDWSTTSVKSITAYWVRAKLTSYTSITTQPKGTQSWVFLQIMNEQTIASGVASESYNYTGGESGEEVTVLIRKSSTGATKYFPASTTQTIRSSGLTLSWTLITDTIASA